MIEKVLTDAGRAGSTRRPRCTGKDSTASPTPGEAEGNARKVLERLEHAPGATARNIACCFHLPNSSRFDHVFPRFPRHTYVIGCSTGTARSPAMVIGATPGYHEIVSRRRLSRP